jgi:hypothetical protein
MNPLEEETTQPARLNPNLAAQGAMVGIRRTPWYSEFVKEYKEEPDLSRKADYDYRKAWLSGARPEKDPHDAGRYHWPSSTASGEMLKSSTHPTHWKELYMRKTGVNPDTVGATIKDWIRIKNYADGGAVNPISAGIASLGRGPDSTLVHMSPREVAGLQTLAMKHGGSLTINPHTGLPEAGFLDSILPMVAAGATAAFMPAAAPAFLPMLAGAGVGALTNKQSPLMGALLGGLSGYGMSGLGETFGKLGAEEAAKQAAIEAAKQGTAAGTMADTAFMQSVMSNPESIVGSGMMPQSEYLDLVKATGGVPGREGAVQAAVDSAYAGVPTPTRAENILSGAGQAFDTPESAFKFAKGNYKNIGAAAAPLISYGIGSLAQQPTLAGGITGGTPQGRAPKYTYGPMTVNPRFGQPGEPYFLNQTFTATAAEGGMVPRDLNNRYPQSNINQSAYATASQSPMSQSVVSGGYEPKINPFTGEMQMAAGGALVSPFQDVQVPDDRPFKALSNTQVAQLAEESDDSITQGTAARELYLRRATQRVPTSTYTKMADGGIAGTYAAGGRLLRGDGDGVSDSIPAEIHSRHGVQKAALADGEFVLPARIVSEIGNGSTEAGARKLYAMMDRIQKRRGKTLKNVAANTKAERLLPA